MGQPSWSNSVDQLLETAWEAVAIAYPRFPHSCTVWHPLPGSWAHVLVEKAPGLDNSKRPNPSSTWPLENNKFSWSITPIFFNPAVRRIKELVDYGELGDLYYVDSISH